VKRENQNSVLQNLSIPTPRVAPDYLEGLHENRADPYNTLVEALSVLDQCDDARRGAVRAIVVEDAQNLACRLLPQEVVDELGLHVNRPDDVGFEQPPNLRALFLLVRSYDATGDQTLVATIEHILDNVPPLFSEELIEAFKRAEVSRKSVMEEFNRLAFAADEKVDGYTADRVPFPYN
jgi:hypothetical protein